MIEGINDLDCKNESEMKIKTQKKFIIQKCECEDLVKYSTSTSELGIDEKNKEFIQMHRKLVEPFLSSFLDNKQIQEKSESESGSSSSECRNGTKEEKTFNTGRWTEEEHKKFLDAILIYGNEWKKVQKCISTRSSTQARSHAQKFFLRIKKIFKTLEERNELIENPEDVDEKFKIEEESTKDSALLKLLLEITSSADNREMKTKNILGGIMSSSCHNISKEQRQKLMNVILKFSSGADISKKRRKKSLGLSEDEECEINADSLEDNSNEEQKFNEKKKAIFLISKVQRSKRACIKSEKNNNGSVNTNINNISFEQKNTFDGRIEKNNLSNWYQKMMSLPNMNPLSFYSINPGPECLWGDCYNINDYFGLERYIRYPSALPGDLNSFQCAVSCNNFVPLANMNMENKCSNNTMYDELKTYFIKRKKNEPKQEVNSRNRHVSIHSQQYPIKTDEILDSMVIFSPKQLKKNVSTENIHEELNPFSLNFDQVLGQTKNRQDSLKLENSQFPEGESMKVEYDDYNI